MFKSGTANLIEGGLGGQVNVRSRRPFDFTGFELSGSLNAVKFEQSGEWEWNGNLLVSNRWDVGDGGEFGILVNVAMTNTDFLDSTRENDLFVSPRPAAGSPGFHRAQRQRPVLRPGRPRPSVGERGHPVQAQRRPAILRRRLYQGYRGNDSNFWMFVPLFDNSTLTNVEFDENGLPIRARVNSPNAPDGFQEFRKSRTHTYQIGGGIIYD